MDFLILQAKKNKILKRSKKYKSDLELLSSKTDLLISDNETFLKNEMSKELHDNILSAMSGMRFMTESMLSTSEFKKAADIKAAQKIHGSLQSSYKQLENYIDNLRFGTEVITNVSSLKDLEELVRENFDGTEVRVIASTINRVDHENISTEVKFHLERIVKELVSNIVKHARASAVTFNMTLRQTHLELLLHDDGRGYDVSKQSNRGLKNIEERVATLNGKMTVVSSSSTGTLVELKIPLRFPDGSVLNM